MNEITAGAIHRVRYPFHRDTFTAFDEDGGATVSTWIPGTRNEPAPPYGEDFESVADGMGFMHLHVVSLHKPGKYPERVFYVRKWEAPDGHQFGKGALRMTTLGAFRQLLHGYRFPYTITPQTEQEAT